MSHIVESCELSVTLSYGYRSHSISAPALQAQSLSLREFWHIPVCRQQHCSGYRGDSSGRFNVLSFWQLANPLGVEQRA